MYFKKIEMLILPKKLPKNLKVDPERKMFVYNCFLNQKEKAVAILPSTAIYPQRLFCRELFVIGQS